MFFVLLICRHFYPSVGLTTAVFEYDDDPVRIYVYTINTSCRGAAAAANIQYLMYLFIGEAAKQQLQQLYVVEVLLLRGRP